MTLRAGARGERLDLRRRRDRRTARRSPSRRRASRTASGTARARGPRGADALDEVDAVLPPVEVRAVDDPRRHAEDAERDGLVGARAEVVLDRGGRRSARGRVAASWPQPTTTSRSRRGRDIGVRRPSTRDRSASITLRVDARRERRAERLDRSHRMLRRHRELRRRSASPSAACPPALCAAFAGEQRREEVLRRPVRAEDAAEQERSIRERHTHSRGERRRLRRRRDTRTGTCSRTRSRATCAGSVRPLSKGSHGSCTPSDLRHVDRREHPRLPALRTARSRPLRRPRRMARAAPEVSIHAARSSARSGPGFHADRLGYAFVGGYSAALARLFERRHHGIAAREPCAAPRLRASRSRDGGRRSASARDRDGARQAGRRARPPRREDVRDARLRRRRAPRRREPRRRGRRQEPTRLVRVKPNAPGVDDLDRAADAVRAGDPARASWRFADVVVRTRTSSPATATTTS